MNGKGKEYNVKGKLIFQGEYLKGKRWNGKLYNPYNNSKYEIINGYGKLNRYILGYNLIFDGEYSKGEINGLGKLYNNNNNLLFIIFYIILFKCNYLNLKCILFIKRKIQ